MIPKTRDHISFFETPYNQWHNQVGPAGRAAGVGHATTALPKVLDVLNIERRKL